MNKHESIVAIGIAAREAEEAKNKRSQKLQKTKKHPTSRSSVSRSAARVAGKKSSQRGHRGITIKQNKNGSQASGLISYAQIKSKNHEIISTNCDDAQSFISTTNHLSKMRKDIKKNVGHITLSLPADSNFNHDNWAELVDDARASLGLNDSYPYICIRHFDTEHPHAHLVFSRISVEGKVHDQSNLGLRCASAEQLVEEKYNLNLHPMRKDVDVKQPNKKELEMQLRTGELSTRAKFQGICQDAMKNCDNIVTYFARLQAVGFEIELTMQDEGKKISGIVYHRDGQTMKASDLGKSFTFNGLTKTKGLLYDKNRDLPAIIEIQNRTAFKQFIAAGGDASDAELSIGGTDGGSPATISHSNEPISSGSSSNGADARNRNGQWLGQDRVNEQNRSRIQRPTASQPAQTKSDLGRGNDNYQSAIGAIADLADATIESLSGHQGTSKPNQPAPNSNANAAAQEAQIKAFGRIQLQLSIRLAAKADGSRPMIKRDFDSSSYGKFRRLATEKHALGADIYVAPHPDSDHAFILLDDLTNENVNRMKFDGIEPAILVESSPSNWQAWVKLSDKPLSKEQRLEASRLLTKKYDADGAAVGSVRIGRLAGNFTNQKPEHKNKQGLQPYCKLTETRSGVATNGHLIVLEADEAIANSKALAVKNERVIEIQSASDYLGYGASPTQFFQTEAKKILNRYGNETDLSRLDFMVCKTMHESHQFGSVQIAQALREASPNIDDRKHNIEDYIERTVSKARAAAELQRQLQQQQQNEEERTNNNDFTN